MAGVGWIYAAERTGGGFQPGPSGGLRRGPTPMGLRSSPGVLMSQEEQSLHSWVWFKLSVSLQQTGLVLKAEEALACQSPAFWSRQTLTRCRGSVGQLVERPGAALRPGERGFHNMRK